MKILIVGAGAVGQVYAWHLSQAGHEVSFFVKAKYAQSLSNGATLYRLGHWRKEQQKLSGFSLVTDVAAVAAQRWDHVWLALPSDAMRGALAAEIMAAVGQATVVCLQPDVEDIDYVRCHVPPAQLVQGLITFISYQSPLPGLDGPEGIAYYLPPMAPGLFSGEATRVANVVSALMAGGLSAKSVPDFAQAAAAAPAMLQPLIAALEVHEWRLNSFTASSSFHLGLAASREALAVVEMHVGADIRPLKPLLSPLTWRLVLPVIKRLAPFDLEQFIRYHYSKVRVQSLQMLDSYIRIGKQHGLPTPTLESLRTKMASAASLPA